MATTSIWKVEGWLGKVVSYAENPEKTTRPGQTEVSGSDRKCVGDGESLSDVIAYAVDEEKTRRGTKSREGEIDIENISIMQQYVSGINCCATTARGEMEAVKKRYGKDGGIVAYHGYQSFAPGECTPEMAHEIGVKLAEELWGERFQVVVATHLDKAHHLHNHFVVNSVSFSDGLRYHRTKRDYQKMRSISDCLCREYGLSVIEQPQKKGKHYGEWRAEQEQKPTYRSTMRADVDEAIRTARTEKQFFQYLQDKGYSVKFGKDITLCEAGRERGLKLARNFGEDYTLASIRRRILDETERTARVYDEPEQGLSHDRQSQGERSRRGHSPEQIVLSGTNVRYNAMKSYSHFPGDKKPMVLRLQGSTKKTRKIGGLRGLYIRYCFLLGILPKDREPGAKQIHYLFRDDLKKLDTISKETKLLCHYRIDTAEQLFSFREKLEGQIAELTAGREHLRYQSRSLRDSGKLTEIKTEIADMTKRIKSLREEVRLCGGIAARSEIIKEKLEMVRKEERKEKGNIRAQSEKEYR